MNVKSQSSYRRLDHTSKHSAELYTSWTTARDRATLNLDSGERWTAGSSIQAISQLAHIMFAEAIVDAEKRRNTHSSPMRRA